MNSNQLNFAGQTGTTPAIPGMFPNMLPFGTGQVCVTFMFKIRFIPSYFYYFNLVLFVYLQQFGVLPVMPIQAMTQQVGKIKDATIVCIQ